MLSYHKLLKIPELRKRFSLPGTIVYCKSWCQYSFARSGPTPIKEFFELREQTRSESDGNDILGFYNTFTGGALLVGLFALGIMPYISASIIMH